MDTYICKAIWVLKNRVIELAYSPRDTVAYSYY